MAPASGERRELDAVTHDQGADTLRSTELVGAHRDEIDASGASRNIEPTKRLDGVGVNHRVRSERPDQFGKRLEGLDNAGFVVGQHHRNDADRLGGFGEKASESSEIDEAGRIDRRHEPAEELNRIQDCVMLDGGTDADSAGIVQGSLNGQIVGLGTAAGENDFARLCTQRLGHDLPGIIEHPVGFPSKTVRPRRIAITRGEQGQHGFDRGGTSRSARGVVEVVGHDEKGYLGAGRRVGLCYHVSMQGFGPSTYGDGFADVYDDWYGNITDAAATARFVAERCATGPVLELGVGSGRLVPDLVAAGCRVIGIDGSRSMLEICARKLRAERIGPADVSLVVADLASLPVLPSGKVGAALCAFNTLFNLPTEAAQADLLHRLASALAPNGSVIIEAITGYALDAGPASSVGVSRMTADQLVLSATLMDIQQQTIQGQHVEVTEAGIKLRPWMLRWTTPSQLDALAADAGLELVERYVNWTGEAYREEADTHVSVFRRIPDSGIRASND